MKQDKWFVTLLVFFLVGLTLVMLACPRSHWSKLERRELQSMPRFELRTLRTGEYTNSISSWFSDTEPFRDVWMRFNLMLESSLSFYRGDDAVSYHRKKNDSPASQDNAQRQGKADIDGRFVLVCGEVPTARGLMPFVGDVARVKRFARLINRFDSIFDGKVQVYCMAIPLAIDFYCPPAARSVTTPQRPIYDSLRVNLSPRVKFVDIYETLDSHHEEPIYLRTDHHWNPLGGFYAAQVMAQTAGLHVPSLDEYEPRVLTNFVGTLYGYSQDKMIADSPEDFAYYVPRVPYSATLTTFETDADYGIVDSVGTVSESSYFLTDEDEMRNERFCVYSFAGPRLLQVRTAVSNGRRLLVLKDSFGDAFPSFLFGSYEEVHIADYRYFPRSLGYYIQEQGITDLLFSQCLLTFCGHTMCDIYSSWLDGFARP